MSDYHQPVMIKEFLSFFENREISYFIDATLGSAGHSLAILEAHPEIERLVAIDQDENALELAEKRLKPFQSKITLLLGNFRDIDKLVPTLAYDGIFYDVGISSIQLDDEERGFSFMADGPLDMRKDQNQKTTAASIINHWPEKKLADLFWLYGEEPRSRRAAKAIVMARGKKRIETTGELVEVLKPVLTWHGRKNKNIHPMTLVFQALRIEVNDELTSLKESLPKAILLLKQAGRLGVVSFQSLEDRIVKEAFREAAHSDLCSLLTKKPLIPTEEEISLNPRSRSSKLRFIEKL